MSPNARPGVRRTEVIVAIVIAGVLAVIALPRLGGPDTERRVAAVKGMGGALRSAAELAHGICMAQACVNDSVIVIEGQSITFVNGYPNNATIGKLVQRMEGFTRNVAGDTFARNDSHTNQCWVRYSDAIAGQAPTISYQAGTITDAASETFVNNALRQQC